MADGANLGVTAGRALGTVLGGADQPTEEERATPEEVRERILAAPLPGDGEPPWVRVQDGGLPPDDGYSLVADSLAHAFLVLAEEDPEILDRQLFYPEDCEIEVLRGKPIDLTEATWEAAAERWTTLDEWLGGVTGFQVGFAFNTVRYALGKPPASNPAIVEIG